MKVYLDNCSLQRPLDSKEQIRNAIESEAVLLIFLLCETDLIELVSSEVLLFEINRSHNPSRREFALKALESSSVFATIDEGVKRRAKEIVGSGVMPLDALHLAVAESAGADYFCTCDDKLLRKARALTLAGVKPVSPLQLLEELENDG